MTGIAPRRQAGRLRWRRCQRGSAVAEFALVSVVLVPLFFAILQLGLIWHVRTTLTSAASEGARLGAEYGSSPEAGRARTAAVIADNFGTDFAASVGVAQTGVDGQPGVEVDVRAQVPVLAFWGPTVTVEVRGHAIQELLP